MNFAFKKKVDLPFNQALANIKELLSFYGFGIITEIDVKATFKNKLEIDYDNYQILGACHPDSAHRVLQADKTLGLMLPCNVIVYEEDGSVFAATILPAEMLRPIKDENLKTVAEAVEEKLRKVIEEIE